MRYERRDGGGENVIPSSERLLLVGGGRPPLERRRLQVREPSDSGDPALGACSTTGDLVTMSSLCKLPLEGNLDPALENCRGIRGIH